MLAACHRDREKDRVRDATNILPAARTTNTLEVDQQKEHFETDKNGVKKTGKYHSRVQQEQTKLLAKGGKK
jgi:hypothetical protein